MVGKVRYVDGSGQQHNNFLNMSICCKGAIGGG